MRRALRWRLTSIRTMTRPWVLSQRRTGRSHQTLVKGGHWTGRALILKGQCHEIFDFRFFTAGVIDTGGKMPPVSLSTPVANLLPVWLTPVSNITSGIGNKFAAGVVYNGGAPWLVNISANFRKKFKMTLMLLSVAWGKIIHKKNPRAKNLVTLSL